MAAAAAAAAGSVTEFQEKVYLLLLQIPRGRLASYLSLSKVLDTSPRAVGGALRCNPYAPHVPCHRVIAANGYIGGFKGDWDEAPSGHNQSMKRDLLKGEGVVFDDQGMLMGDAERVWFDGPWDMNGKSVRMAYVQAMEDAGPEAVSEMKARRERKKK